MAQHTGAKDTRSILKNTTASFMALMISQGAAMVSAIYLARKLGPSITGVYAYSFGVVSMVILLANCGTDQALTREVTKDRKSAGRLFISTLCLRMPASAIIYVSLLLLLKFNFIRFRDGLPVDGRALLYVVWLTLFVESAMQAARAIFAGLERQEVTSAVITCVAVLRAALTILVVYLGLGLFHMGMVVLIVGVAGALVTLRLLSRVTNLEFRVDPSAVKSMARMGSSFLLMDVCLGLVARFDYMYLPTMVTRTQLGLYTSAYTLAQAVVTGTVALDTALFPIITRRCEMGIESLKKAWDMAHKYLAMLAVPVAVSFVLLAEEMTLLVYGDKFAGSGAVLRILIWYPLAFFPMIPSYRILIARNSQMRLMPLFGIRAVVNITLNLLLVPIYGIIGSAIAMAAMEALHCALCFVFPFRTVERFPIIRWYVRPMLAGLPMAALVYLLRDHFHVLIVASLGLLLYAFALVAFKALTSRDVEMFREAIHGRSGTDEEATIPEGDIPS